MQQYDENTSDVSIALWIVFALIIAIALTAQCISLYRSRASRFQESADKVDLTSVHGSVAGAQVNV